MKIEIAIKVALQSIEKEIKSLNALANTYEKYGCDEPGCISASKRRKVLIDATQSLEEFIDLTKDVK